MKPINVLISLYKGYGLGDSVQMSSVLKHVVKYRPHWVIDYQAEEGKYQVGEGIVDATFSYENKLCPETIYNSEVQIILYDTWSNWHDRPNTRVSSCLHERFGLEWDASCGRYEINVSEQAYYQTEKIVPPCAVAIHYEGDSSPLRKNLSHLQAEFICKLVEKSGRVPLLLDWRDKSPLVSSSGITTVGRYPFSLKWGGNAEMNCAVISQCEAFIGIDSGPGKCAGATETPSLVVWTGHHPAEFYDPVPNVTHLVPVGYHGLEPICNDSGVIKWFESNYNIRMYNGDPVDEIRIWLLETLR